MPLHEQVFALSCLAICLYAIARGGAPERIAACSFIAALFLTHLFRSSEATLYQSVEWRIALVDGSLLAVLVGLACCSTRYWAVPMASMQLIDVLGHVSKGLDPRILPQAYFMLVAFISFPMIAMLGVVVLLHRRRLAQFGIDYAWAAQLPPIYRAGWHAHERPGRHRDREGG